MFENETQDVIIQRMLDRAGQEVSVIEGSFTYNAISLIAVALEDAYDKAEEIYQNAFEDTCDREHLIRFARKKNLFPFPAVKARYTVSSAVSLSVGDELTDGEMNFTVTEGGTAATVECQTAGIAGNGKTGKELSAVTYIEGFSSCVITVQTVTGEEEESTEAFRERYFEALNVSPQYGNKKGYKEAVEALDGVGRCEVTVSELSGSKIVHLKCTDEDFLPLTAQKITELQNIIDPLPGEGDGIASIGHNVSVSSVSEQSLAMLCYLTLEDGVLQNDIMPLIEQIIDNYLKEINSGFGSEALIVRKSHIESRVIALDGVIDFEIRTINGQTAGSFTLSSGYVGKRGQVIIT